MSTKQPASPKRRTRPGVQGLVHAPRPLFLDTSVILRWMFAEANPATAHPDALFYASVLLRVEARRTLDRVHRQGVLSATTLAESERWLTELDDQVSWVPVPDALLAAAALPLRTVVGTLDALHLVSAIAVRNSGVSSLVFATHDKQLGTAASAHAFDVIGLT